LGLLFIAPNPIRVVFGNSFNQLSIILLENRVRAGEAAKSIFNFRRLKQKYACVWLLNKYYTYALCGISKHKMLAKAWLPIIQRAIQWR